jgi:hypothetical protein
MHAACPKATKFLADSLESDAAANFMRRNSELLRFLSEKTGLNLTNPKDTSHVYDPIFCQVEIFDRFFKLKNFELNLH